MSQHIPQCSTLRLRSDALDDGRDPHPDPHAHRRQSVARVGALELVDERADQHGTGGAEGAIDAIESIGRLDPEFITFIEEGPTAGTYVGKEGYRKATSEWLEVWSSFEIEARKMIELNDDAILIIAHQRGTAKGAGIEIEAPFHYVMLFEGETLRQFHLYNDRARADAAQPVER